MKNKIFGTNTVGFILINLLICYNLAISQTVVIKSGVNIKLSSAATLNFSNGTSLTINSTTCDFSGTVVFSGTKDQSVDGVQQISFANLVLNKTGLLNLMQNMEVTNKLTLTNGILCLNNFNLLIKNNAIIDGTFSASSMIAADSQGKLLKEVNAVGSYFFPVGDITYLPDYSPVKLDITAGRFTAAVVSINLKNAKHPLNYSTTSFLNRYWTIRQTGIRNLVYNLKLSYASSDIAGIESNIYGALLVSDSWKLLSLASGNQLTGAKLTVLSDITGIQKSSSSPSRIKSTFFDLVVSKNGISVKSKDNIQLRKIQIYNTSGQLVFAKDLEARINPDISTGLRSDMYLIKISTDQDIFTEKVFLQ